MRYGLFAGNLVRGGLFLVVLAAVAVMVIGCGSSESADSSAEQEEEPQELTPLEAVQVAYRTTTTEAKTAKVDSTTTVSGLPNDTTFDTSSQGIVDFENQAALLTVTMPMGMGDTEVRQIGTVIYQRMPEAMQAQMSGRGPWIRIDLDEVMQEQLGASFSQLQGNAPNDPSQQLGYLKDVSDSVEEVGEEEVRGVQTTHYRAEVDLEKAAEEGDPEARQAYDRLQQQFGTTEVPVEVWIDEEGLVRRTETSMSVPLPPEGAPPKTKGAAPPASENDPSSSSPNDDEGQVTVVQEFYDFGTPVIVEPPPEEQVTDFQELMATAQQRAPQPR